MISENLKKLAKLNGLEELLKKQEVVNGIREEFSINDEFDVLHDAILCIFDIISELHEGEIHNEKFMEYHNKVQAIKDKIKQNINNIK